MSRCPKSGTQVDLGDGGGEQACPSCGEWVEVPEASGPSVWPEFRTRWPQHSSEVTSDPDAALEEAALVAAGW